MMSSLTHTPAKWISVVFHPLWIPSYAFVLIAHTGDPSLLRIPLHLRGYLTGIVLVTSGIIPALLMWLMVRLKMISTLDLPIRQERTLPILITAVFFYLTFFLLNQLGVAPIFGFYMLGATTLAILCLFINLWWKISLHLTAFGGFFGALIGISILIDDHFIWLTIIVALVSGLVAVSRLKMRSHNLQQVYAGFIVGTLIMYLLFEFVG
ncbi:MAG: hypothetical protein RBR10_05760 [Bacteroidales bacterium]|jgi:hypothetical protein|nr:hypothetical protein [Bacteroidales bacterium]